MRAATARPRRPKAPYDFETLTADVVGLMDHLKIDQAHFLGLSMGGMVGQYLGLLHPKRVPEPDAELDLSRVPPEGQALWERAHQGHAREGHRIAGGNRDAALGDGRQPESQAGAWSTRLAKMIRGTSAEGFCGWGGAISTLNVTDRLKAISLPTNVIVGAEDPARRRRPPRPSTARSRDRT